MTKRMAGKTLHEEKTRASSTSNGKGKKPLKNRGPRNDNKKHIGTCFVLMPFREPFDVYYGAIFEPAVRAAKLVPLRGDSLFRPSPIMADIWQMIQDAKVLLAELTTKNANVFYELGLAHAIGKPVILVSETMEDVPFDLQPLRVILYNKNDPDWGSKLRDSIISTLEETVQDTAEAVPAMFRKSVKSQAPGERATNLRLVDLERRLASLQESRSVGSPRPSFMMAAEGFQRIIATVRSRDEAIRATKEALVIGGVPSSVVEAILAQSYTPGEAKRLLESAQGLRAMKPDWDRATKRRQL